MNRMPEDQEGSDATRVAQALAGDRDAFRLLVERHSRSIFRLAYRMTGNEQDAEEVVQETFLKAYRYLDRFQSRSNFGTWLYRIGANCSLDLMRKRRAHTEHQRNSTSDGSDDPGPVAGAVSPDPAPDRLVLSAELSRHVSAALDGLSTMERAAFVMRHFDGMSIDEIGRALKLGNSATKNSVFRAVQKLRQALGPFVTRTPSRAHGTSA